MQVQQSAGRPDTSATASRAVHSAGETHASRVSDLEGAVLLPSVLRWARRRVRALHCRCSSHQLDSCDDDGSSVEGGLHGWLIGSVRRPQYGDLLGQCEQAGVHRQVKGASCEELEPRHLETGCPSRCPQNRRGEEPGEASQQNLLSLVIRIGRLLRRAFAKTRFASR